MASPSSSISTPSPPPLLPLHPLFSTIPEGEREDEDDSGTLEEGDRYACRRSPVATAATAAVDPCQRRPTPLHRATPSSASARTTPPKEVNVAGSAGGDDDHGAVSCNKCRPSAREKISVVPLDGAAKGASHGRASSFSSPWNGGGVLRSFFSSLTWRSPRLSSCSTASPAPPIPPTSSQEEEWRLAATELSHKLIHATRKRDEALMEASRLKLSMTELEKKLTRLENHCRDLKSALDLCGHADTHRPADDPLLASPVRNRGFPVEPFLHAVSETRAAVRYLSRALVAQIRQAGAPPKAQERILQLLQPYDARLRGCGGSVLFYLEALLSRSFFEDFEFAAFQRGVSDQVLDPRGRAQANLASYEALRGLSWEDVLSRGTRHYSEGFSRFCDRKMSEVAGTVLGGGLWGRGGGGAWPEPLLQAFFGAAKGVWLVHLLAWCDHPPVPLFRVDKGVPFDAGYMEDAAADRVRRLAPAAVKIMVAPGFYVRDSVVKCKVLCMYHKLHGGDDGDKVNNMVRANHVVNDNNGVINRRQDG